MTDALINILIVSGVGVIGYIIREIWAKLKDVDDEICEMRAELIKREEVNHLVEREINRLRSEIKNDHQHLKDLLAKTDEKLDMIYDLLREKQ